MHKKACNKAKTYVWKLQRLLVWHHQASRSSLSFQLADLLPLFTGHVADWYKTECNYIPVSSIDEIFVFQFQYHQIT